MFKIIEMQTINGNTSHIVTNANTQNEAEAEFHRVMAAAAVSNVEIHACTILTETGFQLMTGFYKHEPVAAEPVAAE